MSTNNNKKKTTSKQLSSYPAPKHPHGMPRADASVGLTVAADWVLEEMNELSKAIDLKDAPAAIDALLDAMGVLASALCLFEVPELLKAHDAFKEAQVRRGRPTNVPPMTMVSTAIGMQVAQAPEWRTRGITVLRQRAERLAAASLAAQKVVEADPAMTQLTGWVRFWTCASCAVRHSQIEILRPGAVEVETKDLNAVERSLGVAAFKRLLRAEYQLPVVEELAHCPRCSGR